MVAQMTPWERVVAALRHEEADRVPFDCGGTGTTSLIAEAYENLKAHEGISAPTLIMYKAFRVARLDEETMRRLGSDLRPVIIKPPQNWSPPPSEPGTFVDEFGIKWRQVNYSRGYYWELAGHPLANATVSDLDAYPWPDVNDPGRYAGLAEEVRDLFQNTPYALVGDSGFKGFWEPAFMLRGLTQALMDLVQNPEFMHALLDKLFQVNAAITRRFLEITGPYLAAIRVVDDLATQTAPIMSPATYRAVIKPYHKRFCELIRKYTDAVIVLHSCGNITLLVDDLIDAGIQALNPVQVSAIPDVAGLKAKYGDRLSFWGGIDSQHILPHGTPEEVHEEVRLRIHQLGQGGGYIAAAVHNIQPDVPPQNIIAMSEAVRELGVYPIS
ncbi:MAG: uroporphyrinogen decarboxylase family protein [Armatimonadota bacterium]